MKAVNLDKTVVASHPMAFKVAATMKASMIPRGFAYHSSTRTLQLCTIFDPRYKTHALSNAKIREEAIRALYDAASIVQPDQAGDVSFELNGSIYNDLERSITIAQTT